MTDFVLHEERFKEDSDTAIFKVTNYAQFLKQPLTLGMFVPCDADGNVLEKPKDFNDFLFNSDTSTPTKDYYVIHGKHINEYYQAKERILFEGFEIKDYPDVISFYTSWGYFDWDKEFLHFIDIENNYSTTIETVENLLKYRLELTESAKKQIGITND